MSYARSSRVRYPRQGRGQSQVAAAGAQPVALGILGAVGLALFPMTGPERRRR